MIGWVEGQVFSLPEGDRLGIYRSWRSSLTMGLQYREWEAPFLVVGNLLLSPRI
ncbi:MAG: hypothetical protein KFF72_12105 [Arthrospira sp. SH-MAG29]|nr:hypothetical protein [Arthrospira sp. SH-MAG29]MBS0017074.1 hypothetical protein [Arthrospira sp. SH-MAG29]